ncbi:hypothetical protein [Exiguobacterium algae]|uniref:hypothetical protein n=1 Tax=Exiguobacterium algae TaxID=2751250 RepID=UPI001BE7AE45|nr:hypothetical protein [Exiguobacterium algae]
MLKNLKWLGAAFEAFLGIPILGGLFIIGMGYSPLGFMFFYHLVVLILSFSRHDRFSYGAVVGLTASVLGFIPIVGMLLHWAASISLAVDAATTRRESRLDQKDSYDDPF